MATNEDCDPGCVSCAAPPPAWTLAAYGPNMLLPPCPVCRAGNGLPCGDVDGRGERVAYINLVHLARHRAAIDALRAECGPLSAAERDELRRVRQERDRLRRRLDELTAPPSSDVLATVDDGRVLLQTGIVALSVGMLIASLIMVVP